MSFKKKYIGDREFYSRMFSIMLPVLLQNVITNFVSLLDNLMVGRVGTEQMSGVAIVNQLLFIFNLSIFGGLAGAGIFTAQFHGKGDREGINNTVRAKIIIAAGAVAVFGAIYTLRGDKLMGLFIHEGEDDIDLAATLAYGIDYLRIIMLQLPLFALVNVYASSLRETGETRLPMNASIISVITNLFLNWVLIYGRLGAPALGVRGAAMATVAARTVECSVLIFKSGGRFKGVWRSLHVPRELAVKIAVKGAPLLANEFLWSFGMTALIQIMSKRGVEVVSAENICNTISNLFFCAFFAMGSTVSIMVGQHLGAGRLEQAVDEARKLIFFSVAFSTAVGAVMVVLAPLVPRVYNTTAMVRSLAVSFIIINATMMPFNAFTHGCYFTLRSGGNVWITFLYDSAYLWVLAVPLTWALVRFTSLNVVAVYAASYYIDIIKCFLGYSMLKSRRWVNNLVREL